MLTSTLRYPKTDRYIRVHESLIAACDKNICAAALIAFFEGWHNYKKQQAEYTAIYNVMAEEAGTASIVDVSGWQYHTMEQLERGVLIYKADQIRTALKLLEAKGYLETEVPDRLRILHKTGRTRWFLLRADIINQFFDSYEAGLRPKKLQFPPPKPKVESADSKALTGRAEEAYKVLKYRARRRVEFWKANNKRVNEGVIGQKQIALVMDRLAEGFSVIALCHAFEGCLSSDHHIGRNERNTVYDSVELVYKDTANVNRFIGYADGAGISLKSTESRFSGQGKASAPVDVVDHKALVNFIAEHITNEPDYFAMAAQFRAQFKALVDWKLVHEKLRDKMDGDLGIYSITHKARLSKFVKALKENE